MAKYRAIDKRTGEYYETEYESLEQLREMYADLEQEIAAKVRLQKKIKDDIKKFMGDEENFELGEGFYFRKTFSEYKNYDSEKVNRIAYEFDLDPIILMSPDKQKIDIFLKDKPSEELASELLSALEVTEVRESLRFVKPDEEIKRQGGKPWAQKTNQSEQSK